MTGEVRWTRRVRNVLSSVANVTGDWFYYTYLIETTVPNMDNDLLRAVFFIVCICSSIFSATAILVKGLGLKQILGCKRLCGVTPSNWASLLELCLEDIPQLVITSMVSYHVRGPLSNRAVFNLTTSSLHFVLDILDIFDEFADDRKELEKTDDDDEGGYQEANVY